MNSSEMARRGWKAKLKKYGELELRKKMSENGKRGAEKRWGVDNSQKVIKKDLV